MLKCLVRVKGVTVCAQYTVSRWQWVAVADLVLRCPHLLCLIPV